jgi:hypothetical protein
MNLAEFGMEVTDNIEGIAMFFAMIAFDNNLTLEIEPPIDQKTYNNIQNLQKLIWKYNLPLLKRYHGNKLKDFKFIIKCASIVNKSKSKRNNTCITTYSGGIDSTETQIRYKDEISHLLYVIGYDVRLESQQELIDNILNNSKSISKQCLGSEKPVVICRSNLRKEYLKIERARKLRVDWTYDLNGFAIACAVYPLEKHIDKLIIPGPGIGKKYMDIFGFLHPEKVDPLASTDLLQVFHNDDLTRAEKIKYISENCPPTLNSLRVCIKSEYNGCLNCLLCDKCIRTALNMHFLGIKSNVAIDPKLVDKEMNEVISKLSSGIIEGKYGHFAFSKQLIDLYSEANSKKEMDSTELIRNQ